jgi:hypothetical protein
MPNIPDITPRIKLERKDSINLLLTSIAMEEISISHILNAEAEKTQYMLKQSPSIHELLSIDRSLERIIRVLIKKEMLLQFKLENVMDLEKLPTELDEDFDEMDE